MTGHGDVSRETSRSSAIAAAACPECGGPDDRHTRGCRACHARYMRRWRARNYINPAGLTAFEASLIRWLRERAR
jgi:hypothetical protein